MARYLGQRLLAVIPVVFLVACATFLIIHLVPGNPAAVILGPNATVTAIRRLSLQMGLSRPLPVQFGDWLGSLVLHGRLGYSYYLSEPVSKALFQHIGPTVMLTLGAEFVATVTSFLFGVLAAYYRFTLYDRIFETLSVLLVSIPDFVLGIEFIYLFAVVTRLFPVAGYVPPSAGFVAFLRSIALPVLVLGLTQTGILGRMVRNSIDSAMHEDYVRTALAKGLSRPYVVIRHALRSSLLVPLTVLGSGFGSLLGGVVILESIFNIPGIGWLAVNAVLNKDYSTVQAVILFVALAYVLVNLGVDLLYLWVDPRTRYE